MFKILRLKTIKFYSGNLGCGKVQHLQYQCFKIWKHRQRLERLKRFVFFKKFDDE